MTARPSLSDLLFREDQPSHPAYRTHHRAHPTRTLTPHAFSTLLRNSHHQLLFLHEATSLEYATLSFNLPQNADVRVWYRVEQLFYALCELLALLELLDAFVDEPTLEMMDPRAIVVMERMIRSGMGRVGRMCRGEGGG